MLIEAGGFRGVGTTHVHSEIFMPSIGNSFLGEISGNIVIIIIC